MKNRSRNWKKTKEKKKGRFVSSLSLSLIILLSPTQLFLMKFHICLLLPHFTFSNSASINNVFWVYVSCLPCITRTSIKNLRKPNQFYFSILFSFPAETDLTMVLNFDLRNWFFSSVLWCLLRETRFSQAILWTIHLINLWQANYSRDPGDAAHCPSLLDASKTVHFLIWKWKKKHGQGSCMYQHILNFYHTFIEHLKDYNHLWEYSRRLNGRSKLVIHMWYHLEIQLHHIGRSFLTRKGCCRFRHRQPKMINLFPFATAQITVLSLQHWAPSSTSIKATWLMVSLSVRPNVYENEQNHCQRNVEHWVLSRGLLS